MSQRQRIGVLVVGLAIAVATFVVLRPGDDDETPKTTTQASDVGATSTEQTTDGEPPSKPRPQFVQIRARGLEPVGGVKVVSVNKGDIVRLAVRSDTADEGHLHGYDISKPVGPGQTARFKFKANLEGIFELELEDAGVGIASLKVQP